MDHACFHIDAILAPFIHRWRENGYEVIVTADHGQDARGHHGGTGEDQRDFAFYYFGNSDLPGEGEVLDQLALAPSILTRMGVTIPDTMTAKPFFTE
jgi:bisphosphoglycerate-independent phosphoglycerate mutase (AlkP superfamily)